MDGLVPGAHLETVKTWYDKLIMGLEIAFGLITLLCAVMYFRSKKA